MALRAARMNQRLSRSRARSGPSTPIPAHRITLHPCGAKRRPCSSVFSAPGPATISSGSIIATYARLQSSVANTATSMARD